MSPTLLKTEAIVGDISTQILSPRSVEPPDVTGEKQRMARLLSYTVMVPQSMIFSEEVGPNVSSGVARSPGSRASSARIMMLQRCQQVAK